MELPTSMFTLVRPRFDKEIDLETNGKATQ